MRRWAVLVALLVGLTGSAQADPGVYAFGDSYVRPGPSLLPDGPAWVDLLGRRVLNVGHPGDTVGQTLARVTRTQREVHGVAVVEVGINDLRRHGTDPDALAAFRRDYALVLKRLGGARRVVVVPPLPLVTWRITGLHSHGSDAALAAYRDVVLELGRTTPRVVVADPLPQWDPHRMLLPDGVHPNAAGRAVIAAAVRRAVAAPR